MINIASEMIDAVSKITLCLVDKSNFVHKHLKYIQIYGPTGREELVAQTLKSDMQDLGLKDIQIINGNLFGVLAGDQRKPAALLSAHMDTVLIKALDIQFNRQEMSLTNHSNYPLGADNRSGIAMILESLRVLKEEPRGDIKVLFTTDEETDQKPYWLGMRRAIKREEFFDNVDIALLMDACYSWTYGAMPAHLQKRNFAIIHKAAREEETTEIIRKAAMAVGINSPIIINDSGPGDNVVLAESKLMPNVIEFASGVDNAHNAHETLLLKIVLEQTAWLIQTIIGWNNAQD